MLNNAHTLFMAGTHVTWGVNLKEDNLTAAFLEAQAIAEAFEAFPSSLDLTLDAIEIGNEADFYGYFLLSTQICLVADQ
jgi:hypothetical protein